MNLRLLIEFLRTFYHLSKHSWEALWSRFKIRKIWIISTEFNLKLFAIFKEFLSFFELRQVEYRFLIECTVLLSTQNECVICDAIRNESRKIKCSWFYLNTQNQKHLILLLSLLIASHLKHSFSVHNNIAYSITYSYFIWFIK